MHLKGPWQYQLLADSSDDSRPSAGRPEQAGRIKLPADWQECFGEFRGRVRYERHFNRPTNLDPEERVYVVFEEIGGQASVQLNETDLGIAGNKPGPFEFEIKDLLQQRNLLCVEVEFLAENEPGGLWAPVAIEIRS